jgi:hypothetical protein
MSRKVSHKPIKQLTIRGFGADLERRIRDLAARENLSLNQAALVFLRRGAGVGQDRPPDRVGDSLDRFVGLWTRDEGEQFDQFIKNEFGKIDPEMWR